MRLVPVPPFRVLALDPVSRGIGYAVIERDTLRLIDWGIKTAVAGDAVARTERVMRLVELHQPSVVVLEDWRFARQLRREALRPFALPIEASLLGRDIPLAAYKRSDVQEMFVLVGARTQNEIADLLASRFPELTWRLPPIRRVWMREDYQMCVFDAVALGLTHINRSAGGP